MPTEERETLVRATVGATPNLARQAGQRDIGRHYREQHEPALEERPARGRRSNRNRRDAAGQEQTASEPQIEPVVLS